MASYYTLSGTVSHLSESTHVSGSNNRTRSSKVSSFRVDGRPATSLVPTSVADGDKVIVAGRERHGELAVFAMHNHTTSTTFGQPSHWMLIVGVIMIIIGIPALALLVGILLIIGGGYLLFLYSISKRSYDLLTTKISEETQV